MGLAASQARLLMLTARKDDVEARLMAIANQKLSLSRQQAELSDAYSAALNAQTLCFDATGEGSGSALTYDMLMGSSAFSNSDQYILTNASTNQVILNDEYLQALSLTDKTYGTASDLGASAYDFAATMLGTTPEECEAVEKAAQASSSSGSSSSGTTNKPSQSYNDFTVIRAAGLESAYNSNYTLLYSTGWKQDSDQNIGSSNTSSIVSAFTSYLQGIANGLSGPLNSAIGFDVSAGIGYAYNATLNKFLYNVNDTNSMDGAEAPAGASLAFANSGQLGQNDSGNVDDYGLTLSTNSIRVNQLRDGNGRWSAKYEGIAYIDTKQVINTFLDYFDQYCAQHFGGVVHSGNTVGGSSTSRSSAGGWTNAAADQAAEEAALAAQIAAQAAEAASSSGKTARSVTASQVEFYLNIYNEVDKYGWQAGGNNSDGLQNQVMNGTVTVKKYTAAGFQTLSTSSSDGPFSYEDANTAAAEAEYSANKDRLDYKESQMDIQMNDLDTERSAITTEVESVQKIIDKNIESSFKIFQA